MSLAEISKKVGKLLSDRSEKFILTESCSFGLLASQLIKSPNIKNVFYGSAVAYHPSDNMELVNFQKPIIKKQTKNSQEIAEQVSLNVLKEATDSDWSLCILGDLGLGFNKIQDGLIFLCISKRNKKGKLKVKHQSQHKLKSSCLDLRQNEALEIALSHFVKILNKKSKKQKAKKVSFYID